MADVNLKIIEDIDPLSVPKITYGNFTETVDLILKSNRFNFLSSETFGQLAKVQINNKKSPQVYWLSGSLTILLSAIIPGVEWIYKCLGFVAGAALIYQGRRIQKRQASEAYNKLTEGAIDPHVAQVLVDWANKLLSSSTPIFQKQKGNISELPQEFRKARNMVLALLGDDRHRQAIGINKPIAETPFLYRIEDSYKIFLPLVKALSATSRYPDYAAYFTSKENTATDKKTREEEIEVEVEEEKQPAKLTETNTPKVQELSNTYKKRAPHARESRHIISVFSDQKLMNAFVLSITDPNFYQKEVQSNNIRKQWEKAFQYILINWKLWEIYRDNPNSPKVVEFVRALYGTEYLDYRNKSRRKQFRTGKNSDINDFVILSGAIDGGDLVPEDKKIK